MPTLSPFDPSRRAFLAGAAGAALAAALPGRADAAVREIRLTAAPGRWPLVGKHHGDTAVWSYDNKIPGPELRIRQGEPVRILVDNRLAEDTTVHWHGIRLPNAMDGVPGLTQKPIRPGETFSYEFTPPDAGTFWYHPHANSLRQIGGGLAGALIVEEREPVQVDRDLTWVLSDWRLTRDAQIAEGFGNMMDAGMAGRIGNTVTVNGGIAAEMPARAGERVRLRLANCSLARIMALRFEGHQPVVVAIDGQPCDPHQPKDGRVILGPAMRADIVLDMIGEPGKRYRVVDDFYPRMTYWLTQLAYDTTPPLREHPLDAKLALPRNPLPEPDLADAARHQLTLQGGMMGGMGGMGGMMGSRGMPGMSGDAIWSINGASMTGDGHAGMPPLLTMRRGQSQILAIRNDTAFWHPMHLHGHSFRVLSRDGAAAPHNEWADTVMLAPNGIAEVGFVADNPGDWMFHCHVTDHQSAGLMTVFRVA